ncbi:hypothetical protein RAZWK3B_09726 [Roseobacter sp. AzwK-3b]|uniref:hypothetical protein n=1 Tax=Roseobacter sp. AzwK-3b TaxID=351016 RepID=UPI0001568E55|nr:hypothetical protein [Roseobacter sp. AzwK-3b]EDM72521.1 hypothetical protein RAZWK3B_09726 [Roseobacter sp. AzwK-3b]
MMDWRRERLELMAYLLEQDWNVFGTLKFVDGRTIGSVTANKLLRSYWNRIDRVFFGHAADRRNIRVPRWCFAHEGTDTENFHVHFLLKSPIADVEYACCVLNAVWTQHHQQTGPIAKNWIMPVKIRRDAVNYVTREYWRLGSATILDDICWDSTNLAELAKYEHDAQAARIHRAASPLWLRQAQQALQAQQAAYAADDGNLVVKRGKAPSR